jgi:predicted DsbA family dithiol-disulfide isomerase
MDPIRIQHFSDVLCVWAYVHQVRVDELCAELGDRVRLEYRFLRVFGDRCRLEDRWRERGGLPAYNEHVKEVVAGFDHVTVHPDIWLRSAPRSSVPCHLVLAAVRLLESRGVSDGGFPPGTLARALQGVRRAFFTELVDLSSSRKVMEIVEGLGLPIGAIDTCLASGEAHAAFSTDLELAGRQHVRVSPTLIFNEGRQRLTGNVGYRVLEANVRELLKRPAGQHSWC